ncbi:rho GTPase-activating protein 4 isoform X2 [Ambystoma mexicanum]|uniref:rho GTPase-activating protein 4 isoform X2 n=1 Tax=Ambystoma mexicanum TaxID=8296 RepID=UPI0037E7200C
MSSHVKLRKERGVLAEYESQVKEIRAQLAEQLKCLDVQVDIRQQLLQDLTEFLRRKAEIELEYSRSLEKLSDRFSSKIRNSKEHQTFRKDQNLLSPVNCWYMILNQTRQESKDHGALSEVYTGFLTQRLSHIGEDVARLSKKSKDVGLQMQEELLKTISEVQAAMKTYQQYHGESLYAEHKLKEAEKQEEKRTGKPVDHTISLENRVQRRSSLKKGEKLVEKRQTKYLENKMKCTKARNDYLLNLNAVNATMNNYYIHDVADLIDCCDLGFHLSLGRTLKAYLSAESRVQSSRQEGLHAIEQAVESLDPQGDKLKIMETSSAAFCPPNKFEYQPHEGDEVSDVRVEALFRNEMVSRFQQIQSRLSTVNIMTEEVNKTLKATMQMLLELLATDECDVLDAFQSSQSTESLKSTGSDTSSKPTIARRRANQQETETFYVAKFKEYLNGRSLLSKLEAKHHQLQDAIEKGDAEDRELSRRSKCLSRNQDSGQTVPEVVQSCIRFINLHGLQHEGIFRVNGSQAQVSEIRNAFERGEDPLIDSFSGHDVDSVAGVLKLYFRGLEKPLFHTDMFEDLLASVQIENAVERVGHLRKVMDGLSQPVLVVLRYLFAFLNHLSQYSDENMMDPHNLAVCFGPTLISIPGDQDPVSVQAHVNEVVKTIIVHQEKIFPSEKELTGPVYEKCMTVVEEDYCDTVDPALEEIVQEAYSERPSSEHGMQVHLADIKVHLHPGGRQVGVAESDTVEAKAKFDYTGRTPQELTFKKGDKLVLHHKTSEEWWVGEREGTKGLIPHSYIIIPEGTQKKLDQQRNCRQEKDAGGSRTLEEQPVEPTGRLRVNSDGGCPQRKREEGSPIRKLSSPFGDPGRLAFAMPQSGPPRLLGHTDRLPPGQAGTPERRLPHESVPRSYGTPKLRYGISVERQGLEKHTVEVDKDVAKNMNSVFKELLGKAILKQGVDEGNAMEPPDLSKMAGGGGSSDVRAGFPDPSKGSPATKKGAPGKPAFGMRSK